VGEHGAGDGFAAHIAADGVMFGDNGELLIGPEAVRAALLPANRARTRMTLEDGGLSADGSVGWTQGTAVVFRPPPRVGEPASTDTLSYLVLWQGGPDGGLKVLSAGLVNR
jgi:hypothetical protein